jgi:hypothetical protein
MNRLALPLLVVVSGCASTQHAFYPLVELQALDAPENHAEVLAHALEVAPTQRTDAWRGVVERAAIADLSGVEVMSEETAEEALARTEAQPKRFPFLARSAPWLAKRADVGVAALPWLSSQRERGAWQRRVYLFAKQDAVTPHLAQRLAQEVLLKRLIPSTAMGLYELALERDGEAVCSDPLVTTISVALAKETTAFTAAFDTCWPAVRKALLEAVPKTTDFGDRLHLCKVLEAKEQAEDVKAACAQAQPQ